VLHVDPTSAYSCPLCFKGFAWCLIRVHPWQGFAPNLRSSCANLRRTGFESPSTARHTSPRASIQLFDCGCCDDCLEIAAPGPNYLVLEHAIREPNGGSRKHKLLAFLGFPGRQQTNDASWRSFRRRRSRRRTIANYQRIPVF
jgi:hypothetical protein